MLSKIVLAILLAHHYLSEVVANNYQKMPRVDFHLNYCKAFESKSKLKVIIIRSFDKIFILQELVYMNIIFLYIITWFYLKRCGGARYSTVHMWLLILIHLPTLPLPLHLFFSISLSLCYPQGGNKPASCCIPTLAL